MNNDYRRHWGHPDDIYKENFARRQKKKYDAIKELCAKPWLSDAVEFYLCKKTNFAHKIQELRIK